MFDMCGVCVHYEDVDDDDMVGDDRSGITTRAINNQSSKQTYRRRKDKKWMTTIEIHGLLV